MAKRTSILDGVINLDALEERRQQLAADLEQINALMAALAGVNGSPRRGGRRGARGARRGAARRGGVARTGAGRRGGGGGRAPKEGTLGGKILAALKSGPKSNAQILAAVKLAPKKRAQLSVNLNNLKKRGFVSSVERGTWAAA